MPLTDEQKAALTTLVVADPKEVAEALQKESANHYQAIYQKGFSTAHNESKTKLEDKEAEIEAERAKIKAKDDELVQLREKSPDLDELRKKHEAELLSKEEEKKAAIQAADKRVEDLHRGVFEAQLAAELIELKVAPKYAKAAVVPDVRNRIKVEKDGTVKFYDDDGITPLSAANGELARVAANKIIETVDNDFILSGVDKGGGTQGGSDRGESKAKAREERARKRAQGDKVSAGLTEEQRKERLARF